MPTELQRDQLPEDLQGSEALKGIETVEALARKHHETVEASRRPFHEQVNLENLGEDYKKEDVQEILKGYEKPEDAVKDLVKLKKNGGGQQGTIPEAPEGYELSPPEGVELDDEMQSGFRQAAHQAGITQDQAEALNKWWNAHVATMTRKAREQDEQARRKAETSLKESWGTSYDQNLEGANRALKTLLSHTGIAEDEEKRGQFEERYGDDPVMCEIMHIIQTKIGEDTLASGPGGGRTRERTDAGYPMLDFPSMEKK